MSKYQCRCGHVMHFSSMIEPYAQQLIRSSTIENISKVICSEVPLTNEQFLAMIDKDAYTVYRCPNCDWIHVSTPTLNSRFFNVYEKLTDDTKT